MKKMKRFAALALAATMVFGGTMTVLADPVVGTGTGEYEGDELVYPVASVTLPTIPEETYDYIADPNGLIELTKNEHYPDATFEGETGVFFETAENTYTEKSAVLSAVNKSAFNVNVSVSLTSGVPADDIVYADSAAFEGTDKALYLALVEDAENGRVAPITTTQVTPEEGPAYSEVVAAELESEVLGKPKNYKASWTGEKYEYVFIDAEENLVWNEAKFYITGALNKDAEWEKGDGTLAFPTITVTWSYDVTEVVPEVVNTAPTFESNEYGVISYTKGAGDDALASITSIIMVNNGKNYDGYKALDGYWAKATDNGATVTFDSKYTEYYKANEKTKATITYVTVGGITKTATVDVVTK